MPMTPAEQQQHETMLSEWRERSEIAKKARSLLHAESSKRAHVHVRSLEAAADDSKRAADAFAVEHPG